MEGKVTELTSYGPDKEPCETLSKHICLYHFYPIIAQFREARGMGEEGEGYKVSLGPRTTDFVFKIFNLTVVREQGFPIVLY